MDTWALIYIAAALTLLIANAFVARIYGNKGSVPREEEGINS